MPPPPPASDSSSDAPPGPDQQRSPRHADAEAGFAAEPPDDSEPSMYDERLRQREHDRCTRWAESLSWPELFDNLASHTTAKCSFCGMETHNRPWQCSNGGCGAIAFGVKWVPSDLTAQQHRSRRPWSGGSCCSKCLVPFSMVQNRRHHCRECGKVFCGTCSQEERMVVPGYGRALQRACTACYAKYLQERVRIVVTVNSSREHKALAHLFHKLALNEYQCGVAVACKEASSLVWTTPWSVVVCPPDVAQGREVEVGSGCRSWDELRAKLRSAIGDRAAPAERRDRSLRAGAAAGPRHDARPPVRIRYTNSAENCLQASMLSEVLRHECEDMGLLCDTQVLRAALVCPVCEADVLVKPEDPPPPACRGCRAPLGCPDLRAADGWVDTATRTGQHATGAVRQFLGRGDQQWRLKDCFVVEFRGDRRWERIHTGPVDSREQCAQLIERIQKDWAAITVVGRPGGNLDLVTHVRHELERERHERRTRELELDRLMARAAELEEEKQRVQREQAEKEAEAQRAWAFRSLQLEEERGRCDVLAEHEREREGAKLQQRSAIDSWRRLLREEEDMRRSVLEYFWVELPRWLQHKEEDTRRGVLAEYERTAMECAKIEMTERIAIRMDIIAREKECSICMEAVDGPRMCFKPCGHWVCPGCWTSGNCSVGGAPKCPTCRTPITEANKAYF
eukprot:TRINITY_DN65207_c0_g1_i1.p1 TRINITY_DN65207_c0_g1~~TRINITY_DN65207_c0_g1_i1.p1  ORF type:complete len:740 (+),score=148.38 TRINITY_DN65207_c0_g1_i1:177-2222(+)